MTFELDEEKSNFHFVFNDFLSAEKFDETTMHGIRPVDFIAENNDFVYYIEVKNYKNPKSTEERRKADYQKLVEASSSPKKSMFTLEMGEKIKNSLLHQYAVGFEFVKPVKYILFLNFDTTDEMVRENLTKGINEFVPTVLNKEKFVKFNKIYFDLLINPFELTKYNIQCTSI